MTVVNDNFSILYAEVIICLLRLRDTLKSCSQPLLQITGYLLTYLSLSSRTLFVVSRAASYSVDSQYAMQLLSHAVLDTPT